ncbi:immunoglobulin domain-containing protein [Phthorimaea operculella]|nr:immunoglobulin domain-containing protein [Phthorimaea operculella]
MNCHLDFPFGNEIPYHLQWDKDGETIFSSVRETDAGLYRCRVTFPNRSPPARNNGTFYYLDVDGSNLIVNPPTNSTVLEGDRAELECSPKAPEWTVLWLKDGEPLESLPELWARAELPANGSLVLRATASSDAGEYTCTVRAPDQTEQSAAAFLDVQYKAKVVYAPEERYLPYGKPASLDCHFNANPPLTNLRWEKDGFLFDPYNVPGVFYSRNGSLLFNQVDESHEGEYSCTPYNALGSAGPSPRVRVVVARPPALATRPLPLYVARLGQALTLPCAPQLLPHHPPPTLHWARKDGADLPVGRHSLDGGNLTIADISEEDRGVYVCTASNAASAASVETELLIENVPPRAPYNLTARATDTTIHLSWIPGHSGLEVDYNIWYRERAVTEWRTMRILSRGVTEGTLVGLRPGQEHELRVLAQDHIGDGLFSRPIYVRTLDPEFEGVGETAQASATTVDMGSAETAAGVAAGAGGAETDADDDGSLDVTVRLLDEGALVRWVRAPADESRCTARWYRAETAETDSDAPADRLLATMHTHHDYVLVNEVEEGARYVARVSCKKMSSRKCCVPECKVICGEVPLHTFPNPEKEPDRFKSWLYNVGGDVLSLDNQFIYKRRRVCHNHFEEKYHTWTNTLAVNAVPTLQLSGFRKKAAKRPLSDVTNVNEETPHEAVTEPKRRVL